MDLLVLPGNHPSIKEWAEEVAITFSDLFDSTQIMDYLHWKERRKLISLDVELNRLGGFVAQKSHCAMFAKSIGTVLAVRGTRNGIVDPEFCIFFGTPVVAAKELGFEIKDTFSRYQVPTLFIQNDEDPSGPIVDLKRFFVESAIQNYELVELNGNTHDYDDMALLREKSRTFYC